MRKGGILIQLPDKRKAIVYHEQPFQKSKGKIIIHLVDDNFNLIIDESTKKPKTLIKDITTYNSETNVMLGFVD